MGEIKVSIRNGEGRGIDLKIIGSTFLYYLHRIYMLNCIAMSLCWEGLTKRLSRRKTFNEYKLLGSCDLIHYFILWMPWVSSLLLCKCV